MRPADWGTLHDGVLTAIDPLPDGGLRLFVEIRYLREMFAGDGVGFVLDLRGVRRLAWKPWDGEWTEERAAILAEEPELLSVQSTEPLVIVSREGELVVDHDEATLALDTGDPVSAEELHATARRYWDAWNARNLHRPETPG